MHSLNLLAYCKVDIYQYYIRLYLSGLLLLFMIFISSARFISFNTIAILLVLKKFKLFLYKAFYFQVFKR